MWCVVSGVYRDSSVCVSRGAAVQSKPSVEPSKGWGGHAGLKFYLEQDHFGDADGRPRAPWAGPARRRLQTWTQASRNTWASCVVDNTRSALSVSGCAGPKTRRRL